MSEPSLVPACRSIVDVLAKEPEDVLVALQARLDAQIKVLRVELTMIDEALASVRASAGSREPA